MSACGRVPIPGSERELDSGHVRTGDVDPHSEVEVTVYLAHRAAPDWVDAAAEQPPAQRRRVAREDWADAHGAAPESIDRVRSFAAGHGLTVLDADAARRTVRLRGTVAALGEAFGVRFEGRYAVSADAGAPSYRGRSGPLTVPQALDGVITGWCGN
jgi:kumamolisin